MSKQPTISTISSGFYSTSALNVNFENIRDQFDNTLSLDGSTPNAMTADLDLNGNSLLNVGNFDVDSFTVNGQVVNNPTSLLDWQGDWATATSYDAYDVVSENGSSYVCLVAHTSDVFVTDLGNNKWATLAEKGDSGPGTGDLLAANNLSDVANATTARNNLGAQANDATLTALAGLSTGANKVPYSTGTDTFGQLDFVDEDDMASDSPTAVPSQQSVKAYVDGKVGNLFVVREQHTSGTTGGVLTASGWTTYAINTSQYNNISGASIASNQITLPAGTYKVSGYGGASTTFNTSTKSDEFKPRLRNITDATTTLVGAGGRPSGYSGTLADEMQMPLSGVFTIASPKTFELQCYANAGGNANTGRPISSGEVEVYAELVFEKLG